jgi:PKD repeat protein
MFDSTVMKRILYLSTFILFIVSCKKEPVADFSYSGVTKAGEEILFTNSTSNAESYFWKFGDESTSIDISPTHIYSRPGTYTVTLEATGEEGSASVSKNLVLTGTSYLIKNATVYELYDFYTFYWNGSSAEDILGYGTFPIGFQTEDEITDHNLIYFGFQYPSGGNYYTCAEPFVIEPDKHNNLIIKNQTGITSGKSKSSGTEIKKLEDVIIEYKRQL